MVDVNNDGFLDIYLSVAGLDGEKNNELYINNGDNTFTEMAKDAEEAGFEGIMVRKNVGYEGKRSHNLLKVKKFHDAEYTVLDAINGNIRWTENWFAEGKVRLFRNL